MSDVAQARGAPLQGDAALIRAVGSFALTAAVINVIVGGGIFRMPAALSAQMGAAAPLALVAGALAIIPIALCFAAIGSRAAATGGPYSYLGATFGPFAGFLAGALMWISNVASSAGVAAALSVQVANLVPAFAQPVPRALLLTGVYVLLFALNAFGVKLGARAITVLAALKLTPLFLLAGIGLFFVDWSQVSFAIGDVPSWAALGASMVLVMFAYSGMETALVPSGEVRDPSRNVPRATHGRDPAGGAAVPGPADRRPGPAGPGAGRQRRADRRHRRRAVGARPRAAAGDRVHLDGRLPAGQPARLLAPGVRAGPRRLPAARLRPRQRRAIACRCWRWPRMRAWPGCWRWAAPSTRWR